MWFNKNNTPEENAKSWISNQQQEDTTLNFPNKAERQNALGDCDTLLQSSEDTSTLINKAYEALTTARTNNATLEAELVYLNVWKILDGRA
jgi:hypothetical protein